MVEARLSALQAQIEPHFLFNTLANVHRLYQTDPGLGRKMLASFVAYLRTALPQMRRDETTLKQEVELARAAAQLSGEVQRRSMALATVLEPLLIVAMGGIVMLIVLAVLLPIIQLNTWVK